MSNNNNGCGCDGRLENGTNVINFGCGKGGCGCGCMMAIGPTGVTGPMGPTGVTGATGATAPLIYAQPLP